MTAYEVLEVSERASQETIRAAYISLMRRNHSDANGGNDERTKQITAAYGVLSDPAKRAQYDADLAQQRGAGPQVQTGQAQMNPYVEGLTDLLLTLVETQVVPKVPGTYAALFPAFRGDIRNLVGQGVGRVMQYGQAYASPVAQGTGNGEGR